MNKRKKLIRDLAEKTGTSSAMAANMLDRNKPEVSREPFSIEDLFERVDGSEPGYMPAFEKEPDEVAYCVNGGRDYYIMAVMKPRRFFMPWVEYEVDGAAMKEGSADTPTVERMGILVEISSRTRTKLGASEERLEEVRWGKVEQHFRRRFEGREGTIRIFQERGSYSPRTVLNGLHPAVMPGGVAIGVLGHAGYWVRKDVHVHALAALSSRVAAVRVVE